MVFFPQHNHCTLCEATLGIQHFCKRLFVAIMESCAVCHRQFGSRAALRNHMRDAENHTPSLKCFQCASSFCSVDALARHVKDSCSHRQRETCVYPLSLSEAFALAQQNTWQHNCCSGCQVNLDQDAGKKCGSCVKNIAASAVSASLAAIKVFGHNGFAGTRLTRSQARAPTPTIEVKCFGCPNTYASQTAMLAHYTSQSCPSGMNQKQLTEIALKCPQSSSFAVPKLCGGHDFKCT